MQRYSIYMDLRAMKEISFLKIRLRLYNNHRYIAFR